jgi:2-amino-4-hydroxy-6-hydroxymethyldihydropteridine diphosphokinase
MTQTYIGLGSNLGDRITNLNSAITKVNLSIGGVIRCSSFYESEPWGFESKEQFVNCVIQIQTLLSPEKLLEKLKEIEKEMGRVQRTSMIYTDRILDLDILYFGSEKIEIANLSIPHPRIYERKFVLEPLAEIAPNWKDETKGKTIYELLKNCQDTSVLKKIVS